MPALRTISLLSAVILAGCETTRVIAPVTQPVAETTPATEVVVTEPDVQQPEPSVEPDAPVATHAGIVSLAPGGDLMLPLAPEYEVETAWFETVVGRYDGRTQAFQASVTAGPDGMSVVLMIPTGPRFMQIKWTDAGISETRSVFAPDDLSALNILADMFVVNTAPDTLKAHLSGDWRLEQEGSRDIWRLGDEPVLEINRGWPGIDGHQIIVFTNHARGYSLEIIREPAS